MQFSQYSNPSDFLDKTLARIEDHESANTLILGLAFRLAKQPDYYQFPPFLATVENESRLILAALMTPPHHITLCGFSSDSTNACKIIIDSLREGKWSVPGVRAPAVVSNAFAKAWAEITGEFFSKGQSLRVYELRKVLQPSKPAQGNMRLAIESDLDLAAKWLEDFYHEALTTDYPDDPRRVAELKIHDREMYFWEDGQPVCMAAATRPTRHGIVVGSVYTPPVFRRRGYASTLVAELSQLQLDRGYRFISLFTDLANPTSNKIYQDVGYIPIGDFQEYHFKQEV